MKKHKKFWITFGIIVAILIILPILFPPLLLLYVDFFLSFKRELIISETSPNKVMEIKIYEKGEPFMNGPTKLIAQSTSDIGRDAKEILVYLDAGEEIDENSEYIDITWDEKNYLVEVWVKDFSEKTYTLSPK